MVTVIIPNYNHARYLEQRIESVLNQTYRDFEIIILDDCSTDSSIDVIEKYRGHPKVASIVYNEINSSNTFTQWIRGIELCKSEFVWIAESDDWCEPSFLENILNGMTEDGGCVVGYCQSYCVQDDDSIKWKSNYPYLSNHINGRDFIKKFMLLNTAIFNASMAVWRRSAFDNISREFTKFRYCGDWLFWIELCMQGDVFVSGKVLNYFRKHDGDISGRTNKTGDNFVEELTLFHLLYERGWMQLDDFLKSLKQQYIHFKSVETSLSREKISQIKGLFFSQPGIGAKLKSYYLGYYSNHIVRKMIKGFG